MTHTSEIADLQKTPLYPLHLELGAQMAAFAGYDLPVRYSAGIMDEHKWCRSSAALFDVSHMGQIILRGEGVVAALEALVPGDIASLKPGRMRYSLFTTEAGGILDDLMITRRENDLFLVVNAACKHTDEKHLRTHMPKGVEVEPLGERALVALQGPKAVAVLEKLAPAVRHMPFMSGAEVSLCGVDCFASRCGYTGEDGFEISMPASAAMEIAHQLLSDERARPAGLGARDSLRLEAGLCLYGADIDATTTPIEAALTWTIGKRRKIEGGFLGAEVIMQQLFDGPARTRVGIRPKGRAPARAHTKILDLQGNEVGEVTSGGFGPSVGGPVAMGYVQTGCAADGTPIKLLIRGKEHDAVVAPLPFVKKGWQ